MTSRIQITLNRELLRQARTRATELHISLTEYVRQLVARDLLVSGQTADASEVFALGNSGGSDIANNKDAMIADAVAQTAAPRSPHP